MIPAIISRNANRGGLRATENAATNCLYVGPSTSEAGNLDPLCDNRSAHLTPADGSLYMIVAFSRLSLFGGGAHELTATVPTRCHRDEKNKPKTCAHASAEPVLYPFLSARLARSNTNKAGEDWVRMHKVPGDATITRRVKRMREAWIHCAINNPPI